MDTGRTGRSHKACAHESEGTTRRSAGGRVECELHVAVGHDYLIDVRRRLPADHHSKAAPPPPAGDAGNAPSQALNRRRCGAPTTAARKKLFALVQNQKSIDTSVTFRNFFEREQEIERDHLAVVVVQTRSTA